MQQFMMDLLAAPDMAEAVIRKVTEYTKTLAQESARAGIDVLCFYDDAGMQTGLQIDPELWRRFIRPRWHEVLDAVRLRLEGIGVERRSVVGNLKIVNPVEVVQHETGTKTGHRPIPEMMVDPNCAPAELTPGKK